MIIWARRGPPVLRRRLCSGGPPLLRESRYGVAPKRGGRRGRGQNVGNVGLPGRQRSSVMTFRGTLSGRTPSECLFVALLPPLSFSF